MKSTEHSPLILLAEDDEANIFTISGYLEVIGYRIILAKNGFQAIALIKSQIPDFDKSPRCVLIYQYYSVIPLHIY